MPQTHHSHSGSFCCHAKNTLPQMITRALNLHYTTLCLTEHVPRDTTSDLYPEELEAGLSPFDLFQRFDQYVTKAREMRTLVQSGWKGEDEVVDGVETESSGENHSNCCGSKKPETPRSPAGFGGLEILIGAETEYIRPTSLTMALELRQKYALELLVGSVHHVNAIPIDFSAELYASAIASCSPPTEARLFEVYFDHQYEVLTKLRPEVVGHWDLVRLFCADYRKGLREYGEGVWERVVRNADAVVGYGGLVEINGAAVRKGWDTPYPRRDVMELLIEKGAKFCLSDDSHSVDQMGLNYHVVIPYLESLGVERVHYLEKLPMGQMAVDMLGCLKVSSVSIVELKKSLFWAASGQKLPSSSS